MMKVIPFYRIKIFISYYREDSAASSGRLYNYLVKEFGKRNVFKDIFSMESGDSIQHTIDETIQNSDAFLVIIGSKWLDVQKKRRASKDPNGDWVQHEITTAFQKQVRVIPVLVDGAMMPQSETLPEELKILSDINASELSFKHYDYDIKNLIKDIKLKVKEKKRRLFFLFNCIKWFVILSILLLASFVYLVKSKHNLQTGENYQGGIVFSIDSSKEHGIICSPIDINSSLNWYDAVAACQAYRGGGFNNWRLPSKDELADLYSKKDLIKGFSIDCNPGNFANCSYWSITQMSDTSFAWNLYFTNGLFWSNFGKKGLAKVRAVRNF